MAVYREANQEALLVACPFNKNHKVAERRFQFHVQYCPDKQRNHMVQCKHNACHFFPRGEDMKHYQTCRDFAASLRHNIESREVEAGRKEQQRKQDVSGKRLLDGHRSMAQEKRHYAWDEEDEKVPGEFDKSIPKPMSGMWDEPGGWKKICFTEDGTLTQPLCTFGMSRLTASERSEYQKMLLIAAKKQAVIRAKAPAVPQEEEELVDTIDWGAGASVRTGLQTFAAKSNARP